MKGIEKNGDGSFKVSGRILKSIVAIVSLCVMFSSAIMGYATFKANTNKDVETLKRDQMITTGNVNNNTYQITEIRIMVGSINTKLQMIIEGLGIKEK